MNKLIWFFILFLISIFIFNSSTYAIVDPLSVPNNRHGIHIIQATPYESSPAASLVNSSGGDWGYITVLIEAKDKNKEKWQEFFNDLRRRHLIPLVRLATMPENSHWKVPDIGEAQVWADFLDSLNWPTKNRYVIIYNEPNHAKEWGNKVDAGSYAQVLDKTIDALKAKNEDFFVLNGGFDASAPQELPHYQDQDSFMDEMNQAVPGIFNKLDGWVSHSYPNPGFVSSPENLGRKSVRTFNWEMQKLRELGVTKRLPIFIAETGWKHAEGISYDPSLPTTETLAEYYKNAYEHAWNNFNIVAVTPFILSYQQPPFDHFSFKRVDGDTSGSPYYPHFDAIAKLPKVAGKPIQDNKATLSSGEIYSSLVAGQTYNIHLTFKNTGQSIWNKGVKLAAVEGTDSLGIEPIELPTGAVVEPGQEYTFNFTLKAPTGGRYRVLLNLFAEDKPFDSKPFEFTTEVKSAVVLQIQTKLKWKQSPAGIYTLRTSGAVGDSTQVVVIDESGRSNPIEVKHLLPDYTFKFTLEKPNYKPQTIEQRLQTGDNFLDFGTLDPSLLPNLLNLVQLWQLLPFSS